MRLRSIFARILAQPRSWLCAVVRRNHLEAEMDAELAFHVEHLTADLIRAGQAPKEAARQARIALGTVTVHKEGMRASLGLRSVSYTHLWYARGAILTHGRLLLRGRSDGRIFLCGTCNRNLRLRNFPGLDRTK